MTKKSFLSSMLAIVLFFTTLVGAMGAETLHTEKIEVDKEDHSFKIGANEVTVSEPRYLCPIKDGETISYPNPYPVCWDIIVDFGDGNYIEKNDFIVGEKRAVSLTGLIVELKELDATAIGDNEVQTKTPYNYRIYRHWNAVFEVKIKDDFDAFRVRLNDEDNVVELGSEQKLDIFLNTGYPKMDDETSGFMIDYEYGLFDRETEPIDYKYGFDSGRNNIEYNLDTSELGNHTVTFRPYFEFFGKRFFGQEKSLSYQVVQNIDEYKAKQEQKEPEEVKKGLFFQILKWFGIGE